MARKTVEGRVGEGRRGKDRDEYEHWKSACVRGWARVEIGNRWKVLKNSSN